MRFVARWSFALLWVLALTTAQAQVTRQPLTFAPLPASINPQDPALTPIQRDEVKRFEIVNKLDFLDRDFSKRVCLPSPPTSAADIDPHRSLFVHDRATLEARDFSLKRTMDQLASQVSALVPGTTGASIFRQFWDAQNPAALALTTGARCSDNAGTLNGFPHACRPPPEEGAEAQGTDASINARMNGSFDASTYSFIPLALVNRVDLAHEGWRNCGEFRLVYGEQLFDPISRNLIIFEGVLPNPTPGCRSGCRPVMQMWKSLSTMTSPTDRAAKLEEFFYTGLPGFRPVAHVDHYSAKGVTGAYGASGSGQIRTNQFRLPGVVGSRWMLKESKTVLDCGSSPCKFEVTPIPVKVTPWGKLWNEDLANSPANPLQPLAQAFQNNTASQTTLLGNSALMKFGYAVSLPHGAPQSFSQEPRSPPEISPSSLGPFAVWTDQYLTQFNTAAGPTNVFRSNLVAGAAVHGLTSGQLVNRAVAQSCAGCHHPGNFGLLAPNSIGPSTTPSGAVVTSWPDSLSSFVHVETFPAPLPELSSPAFPSNSGHALSPALHDVFLPDRRNFLVNQLNAVSCPCPHRFLSLSAKALDAATSRQEALLDTFVPQATQWQTLLSERLAKDRTMSLEESLRWDSQRGLISAQQERELANLRKELGLPSTATSQRPQPLTLEAAKRAEGKLELERDLRQKEVLSILEQEPARRTTTGSFRAH